MLRTKARGKGRRRVERVSETKDGQQLHVLFAPCLLPFFRCSSSSLPIFSFFFNSCTSWNLSLLSFSVVYLVFARQRRNRNGSCRGITNIAVGSVWLAICGGGPLALRYDLSAVVFRLKPPDEGGSAVDPRERTRFLLELRLGCGL